MESEPVRRIGEVLSDMLVQRGGLSLSDEEISKATERWEHAVRCSNMEPKLSVSAAAVLTTCIWAEMGLEALEEEAMHWAEIAWPEPLGADA